MHHKTRAHFDGWILLQLGLIHTRLLAAVPREFCWSRTNNFWVIQNKLVVLSAAKHGCMHARKKKGLHKKGTQQGRANWKTWLVSAKPEAGCFCLPEHILQQLHIHIGCGSYSVQGIRNTSRKKKDSLPLRSARFLFWFILYSRKINNKWADTLCYKYTNQ